MKTRLLGTTFVAVALSMACIAQTAEGQPWLTDSSRAIQFGIGSSFRLTSFDNQSLAVKYHLTPQTAIRVRVSARGTTNRTDSETRVTIGDSLVSSTGSSNSQTQDLTFSLSSDYLMFLDLPEDLFLFVGAGPMAEYSYRAYGTDDWSRALAFGLDGAIGSEWFASHRISVHAEYQAAVLYRIYKSKSTYEGSSQTETRDSRTITWELRSGTVIFGLSVYF